MNIELQTGPQCLCDEVGSYPTYRNEPHLDNCRSYEALWWRVAVLEALVRELRVKETE